MQIISIVQAPCRVSTRPRLLLAKASVVWLWPGVPLTERRGVIIQAISPDATRFWLSKFLGPEIVSQPVPTHVTRAAEHLTEGDEAAAQRCLDRAGAATLSPEGAMLAGAVAARLGTPSPTRRSPSACRCGIGASSRTWRRASIASLRPPTGSTRLETGIPISIRAGLEDRTRADRGGSGQATSRGLLYRPRPPPIVTA